MIMKYAAVALLLAVLTPAAVSAQTPEPKSPPPPSQPKGQGPEIFKVKAQPDSPLRLSVQTYWLNVKMGSKAFDPRAAELFYSVKNVSGRAVSAYALRKTPRFEVPGLCVRNLPPDKALEPDKSEGMSSWDNYSPASPVFDYEVDFVEFKDGTSWGADVCRSAESLAGLRAGAADLAGRLLEMLAGVGSDAVREAVEEEIALCQPDAAMKDGARTKLVGCSFDAVVNEAIKLRLVRRRPDGVLEAVKDESRDAAPPREHSPVWELGFFIGTKQMAERVYRSVKSGPAEIERTLRSPFDAAGAN